MPALPLNPLPTEQTTAATNVLLAVVAFLGGYQVYRLRYQDRWKAWLWTSAFGLLALASLFAALWHGFIWPSSTGALIVGLLNAALGGMIAIFATGALYDLRGRGAAQRSLPVLLVCALAFAAVAQRYPSTFRIFLLYESVAMLVALAIYLWCAVRWHMPGAWWMVGGVLVTLLAAGIQASRAVRVTLIWPFDHNGVFHLVQLVGVLFLLAGLRRALRGRPVVVQPASVAVLPGQGGADR